MTWLPSSRNLRAKSKSDAGGASGDEDSATFEIHKIPFMSVVRGNAFSFWRTDLSARHESCFLDLVRLYGMILIIQTAQKKLQRLDKQYSRTLANTLSLS